MTDTKTEIPPQEEKKVPISEAHLKQLLEYTFRTTRQEKLRTSVINYILIQFNEDSLPAVIDAVAYNKLMVKAVDGLFCVVYLDNYDTGLLELGNNYLVYSADMVSLDTTYAAAVNLMIMLYSRVLGGKHYNFLTEKEKAKQNVIMR